MCGDEGTAKLQIKVMCGRAGINEQLYCRSTGSRITLKHSPALVVGVPRMRVLGRGGCLSCDDVSIVLKIRRYVWLEDVYSPRWCDCGDIFNSQHRIGVRGKCGGLELGCADDE